MSEKEMEELNEEMALKVMGFAPHQASADHFQRPDGSWDYFRPTTSRAESQEVLEKCIALILSVHFIWNVEKRCYEIWGGGYRVTAETLPLAICLFARALYSTGTKGKTNELD